jgi:NAD(P)H-dependent flavin oxidoreductase YrpB (nitropropane dioxygenase family)
MVDVEAFVKVAKGLPFWFAGSYGRKDKLREVLDGGGNGVQVCQMLVAHYSVDLFCDINFLY